MKGNETGQSLVLTFRSKYNHFVLANYNLVLSIHLYRDFEKYKNLSYPFIIKGDLKGKGSKFMLRRPDLGVLMFYEVVEIMITDYYSRFKYKIYKTIPETFKYIHLVEIRYRNEDECDIRSSIIYDNKIVLPEKEFQEVIKFKYKVYRSIELSLRNYIIRKLSTTFTVINTNIELVWNILRNMKMIHKYINLFGNKMNYNGEIIKKDDIIEILKFKDKNQIKLIAKVNRCKMTKMDLTKECIIELLFQKDKQYNNSDSSLTKINIRIYEFKGKCTMYILYHFLNIQDYDSIDNFTKIKNNELNKFKHMIENYKEYSNNLELKI